MGKIFSVNKSNVLIIKSSSKKSIKNLHPRIKEIKSKPDILIQSKLLLNDNLTIKTINFW